MIFDVKIKKFMNYFEINVSQSRISYKIISLNTIVYERCTFNKLKQFWVLLFMVGFEAGNT